MQTQKIFSLYTYLGYHRQQLINDLLPLFFRLGLSIKVEQTVCLSILFCVQSGNVIPSFTFIVKISVSIYSVLNSLNGHHFDKGNKIIFFLKLILSNKQNFNDVSFPVQKI